MELDRSYDDDVSPLVKEAEPMARSYAVASTSQNEFFQDAAPTAVSQSRQKWQEAAQMAVANAQARPSNYAVNNNMPGNGAAVVENSAPSAALSAQQITNPNIENPAPIQAQALVQAQAPAPAPAPALAPASVQVQAPAQAPTQISTPVPEQAQAQFDAVLAAAAAKAPPAQISQASQSQAEAETKAEERPPKEFFAAQEELSKTTRSTFNTAEVNRNIAKSIKALFDTVDTSIHELTQAGVEAMHDDDIERVGEVMKQSKTLKKLRESIVQLSKDWQKSI